MAKLVGSKLSTWHTHCLIPMESDSLPSSATCRLSTPQAGSPLGSSPPSPSDRSSSGSPSDYQADAAAITTEPSCDDVPPWQRLRSYRVQQGLTQQDLAERIGVISQPELSKLENGWKLPKPAILMLMARQLGLSYEALVCEWQPIFAGVGKSAHLYQCVQRLEEQLQLATSEAPHVHSPTSLHVDDVTASLVGMRQSCEVSPVGESIAIVLSKIHQLYAESMHFLSPFDRFTYRGYLLTFTADYQLAETILNHARQAIASCWPLTKQFTLIVNHLARYHLAVELNRGYACEFWYELACRQATPAWDFASVFS